MLNWMYEWLLRRDAGAIEAVQVPSPKSSYEVGLACDDGHCTVNLSREVCAECGKDLRPAVLIVTHFTYIGAQPICFVRWRE